MIDGSLTMPLERAATRYLDHLAVEVYKPGVADLLLKAAQAGVANVRVAQANAPEVLEHMLAPGSVHELWVFFPDPWHKTRHHKRRLVQPEFADLVADRLVPGGDWWIATDWDDYAEHARGVLDAHTGLENVAGGWAPRHPGRPLTRFEQRGLDAGRRVLDLHYRRRRGDEGRP